MGRQCPQTVETSELGKICNTPNTSTPEEQKQTHITSNPGPSSFQLQQEQTRPVRTYRIGTHPDILNLEHRGLDTEEDLVNSVLRW